MIIYMHTQIYESEVFNMSKTFTTSREGNKVIAKFDSSRDYTLSFKDEAEAELFTAELSATQEDFWKNGRDNAVRKKSLFANPSDCTVCMNFDTDNYSEKWPMKAKLKSVDEMDSFFKDVKFAIYGPMPSI